MTAAERTVKECLELRVIGRIRMGLLALGFGLSMVARGQHARALDRSRSARSLLPMSGTARVPFIDPAAASPFRATSHSTTSVDFRATGRDTLKKLGEVAITAAWTSANCALLPLPL